MKHLLATLILITSVVSPGFSSVISIEAANKNALVVNYESSRKPNKSKVECDLEDEIGDIIGIGMTRVNDTITKIIVGIPSDDMRKIVDVQCQEK